MSKDKLVSIQGGGRTLSTSDKVAALRAEYVADAARCFDHFMCEWVESPIEQLLLATMLVEGWEHNSPHHTWRDTYEEIQTYGLRSTGVFLHSDTNPCCCVAQAELEGPHKFRLDFAFVGRRLERGRDDEPMVRVAVELDGHDFHERTKEQASKDKRRDRILAANGWTVLRFTGSDVYRDPGSVLGEIEQVCIKRCWPHMGSE